MINNEKNGALIVLSGPSGCGKDTVMRALLERDSNIRVSVSATTRAPREDEADGVDYYYFSIDEFEQKIEENEFIEYVQYAGNYYGTLKSEVNRLIDEGKKVVLVIEVKGAANIIARYPDCLSIFLMPPSLKILADRLRSRGTDTEDEITKRLSLAEDEIEKSTHYKYVVVNDDLATAIDKVYDIIKTYKAQ